MGVCAGFPCLVCVVVAGPIGCSALRAYFQFVLFLVRSSAPLAGFCSIQDASFEGWFKQLQVDHAVSGFCNCAFGCC